MPGGPSRPAVPVRAPIDARRAGPTPWRRPFRP